MWGKQQSDFNKQGGSVRMTGNKYRVGSTSPHLSELNRSRAGIPIADGPKEKQRQAILKYWLSLDGEKQKLALSMVNKKWAEDHPGHKIAAAKSGHRKCPRISSLERKVETLLREAGVDFIPQYEYELGFVDFLLKPNTALFVNGDYWHNYPDGTEKDKRQLAYLKDHGYETLVIWEHELKEIDNVINRISVFMEAA
jgi:G:T-mismatch repair DNA endonuclease (very short patch repair protein)